jgi:hypothetical protein
MTLIGDVIDHGQGTGVKLLISLRLLAGPACDPLQFPRFGILLLVGLYDFKVPWLDVLQVGAVPFRR